MHKSVTVERETWRHISRAVFLISLANWLKIPLLWAQGFVPVPSETASLYLPLAPERILGFLDQCMTPGCSSKDCQVCQHMRESVSYIHACFSINMQINNSGVLWRDHMHMCVCVCISIQVCAQSYPSVSTGSWFLVFLNTNIHKCPKLMYKIMQHWHISHIHLPLSFEPSLWDQLNVSATG